jgi:methylmalonyl-CoA epimerase
VQVDHIGIAVHRLADSLPRWERLLGTAASAPEEVASQRVRVAFLDAESTHVELLEPMAPESAVGRFLAKRGEGMHHLAVEVPNVTERLADLIGRGERVIDRESRPGARGRAVGFAHPAAFDGVLVEFVEHR